MAFFKCSLFVGSLFCAGVAAFEGKVPNGQDPFSIGKSVSPLGKVISVISDIRDEVVKEGTDEGTVYADFSCFCKEKTKRLSKMVKHHGSEIDLSSKDIALKTADSNENNRERVERVKNHEKFSSQLDDYEQRLNKETASWQNIAATFSNDKHLIKQALNALQGSKQAVGFLQVPQVAGLQKILALADTMGLITLPKHRAAAASLLQLAGGTGADPMASYNYHGGSNDVIDLVKDLWQQMQTLNKEQEQDHSKADASYKGMIKTLNLKIADNENIIHDMKKDYETLTEEIGAAKENLIENNMDMKDSDEVLKQVTKACESRAREFDARASYRKQELQALNTALGALTRSHSIAKRHVNTPGGDSVRYVAALIQDAPIAPISKPNHTAQTTETSEVKARSAGGDEAKAEAPAKVATKQAKPLSFLQSLSRAELSTEDRKKQALGVLLSEGRRVKSLMLTSLGEMHQNDPFKKVKQLITDLRWRLEQEEHAEVDKYVWCKEQVEKTQHERNVKLAEAKDCSVQVERLEAREDKLTQEIIVHKQRAKEIAASITKIYTDVKELSAEQVRAMDDQMKARDELLYAIRLIKSFYSQAAKDAESGALLQESQQPEEMTERERKRDNLRKERRGIHTENKRRSVADGKRTEKREKRNRERIGDLEGDVPATARMGSLGDAIALMDTIASNFDREIGNLEGRLDAEHQELVATNQVLQAEKEHAEELCKLDEQDLKTVRVNKAAKFDDLKTAMDLCDSALRQLEELKPTCIDTGMSYSERVKVRETEMTALRKALCILGEPGMSGCD